MIVMAPICLVWAAVVLVRTFVGLVAGLKILTMNASYVVAISGKTPGKWRRTIVVNLASGLITTTVLVLAALAVINR